MTKIKITIPDDDIYGDLKGKVIKMDADAVDFGQDFVSRTELKEKYVAKANVEEDMQERLLQQATNLKTSLMEDSEYKREFLGKAGVLLDEEGNIVQGDGLSPEDLAVKLEEQRKLDRADWEKEIYAPKIQELESYKSENEKLRRDKLHSEILEAARDAGVKKDKFSSLKDAPRSSKPVIAQTEGAFAYDESHKEWGLIKRRTEDGVEFQHAPEENTSRPFAGPADYFASLKEDPEVAKDWFGDGRPEGGPALNPERTPTDKGNDEQDQSDRVARLRKMRQQF